MVGSLGPPVEHGPALDIVPRHQGGERVASLAAGARAQLRRIDPRQAQAGGTAAHAAAVDHLDAVAAGRCSTVDSVAPALPIDRPGSWPRPLQIAVASHAMGFPRCCLQARPRLIALSSAVVPFWSAAGCWRNCCAAQLLALISTSPWQGTGAHQHLRPRRRHATHHPPPATCAYSAGDRSRSMPGNPGASPGPSAAMSRRDTVHPAPAAAFHGHLALADVDLQLPAGVPPTVLSRYPRWVPARGQCGRRSLARSHNRRVSATQEICREAARFPCGIKGLPACS